jgi:ribosomal protein S15P/S13E
MVRVYGIDDIMSLLKNGLQNRATRSTDLNNESSRSHTILQLSLEMEEQDDNGMMIVTRSTLNLVDLAGSEKWNATLAQAGNANISLQKEMMNINTSLHVLGNCISALIESGRKHIPYRDSVLTRLLQKTIGGNGKTILIATIREDTAYLEETYSTLQFANRASKIKVTINVSRSFSETTNINDANKQIKILKAKLDNLSNNNITNNNTCQSCQGLQRLYDRMQRQIQFLKNENIELKEKLGIPHVKSSDNDDDNNNNSNDYEKIEYLDDNDNDISGNYINDDSSLNYDSGSVWSKSSNNSNTRIDAYNKITIIKSRYYHFYHMLLFLLL